MRSRVCFDAFHSNKLHLLIEVWDADRALFLKGYRGSHIAFPFRLFTFGPRSETDDAKSRDCPGPPPLAVFLGFSILVGTLSRYLPGPLFGTRTDPYPVLIRILPFLVLARTLLRYSPGFYLSRYSSGPFFGSPRFNPFSVLSRTLSRYSPVPFLDTLPDPFLVLDGPFSGTRRNPSPVLARTFLRYSPRFYLSRYSPDHFPVLARTLFWYSPEPFSGTLPEPFPVLTQILPLSQDSLRYFSNTRLDPSPVLTRILPLSGTRLDMISSLALCPDFLGFSGTHSDLIHFPLVYSSIVSGSPSLFG
ncbi:hypothetical protein VitviT2T_018274 [Vitis vinifera]|uniref:Uncharacterized protein n=1 Tax=Vitis vinifera TaxID=29760 RepID=A0ABY9CYY2_VITVI|nr:hypothetical protein VitviT2T_018274 [Vitis vinifera]